MKKDVSISRLIEMAKQVKMSEADKNSQRASFVYGNVGYENNDVSKDYVQKIARELEAQ